jgi:hypothetical protein
MSTLASQGKMRRILDGVVHFQATPFDAQGRIFTNSLWNYTNHVVLPPLDPVIGVTNENFYFSSLPPEVAGVAPYRETFATQMTDTGPTNALPAYVEIEIGTIEPQIFEQLKPIIASGDANSTRDFIKNHSGHIHIFRQQIPVRPTF